MTATLLAQVSAGGIAYWAIILIAIAGIIGIVLVIVRQAGVTIPPFIIQILWIILAVVVGILAIKFIMSIM